MVALFWVLAGLIVYSLAGYGLLWIGLARLFGRNPELEGQSPGLNATVLIAARNEEAAIIDKLTSILDQEQGPHKVDVLVVSDGSQDATLERAQSVASPRVRAFQTAEHGGKAAALTEGLAQIDSDIVIFSDANSILSPGALKALLQPFADPTIGGTLGQPTPSKRRNGWIAKAERLYWHYDGALKQAESQLGGAVSAQGTLYAMRRALVPKVVLPAVTDDFYISVQAVDRGHRLAYVPEAIAVEDVTDRAGEEFMRRVRSTERGWRSMMVMGRLFNPVRHGLYAIQLTSHKALRRLVAFLLPALLLVNLAIIGQGPIFLTLALLQLCFYGLAVACLLWPSLRRVPGASLASFFTMGHAAMALGILRASFGVKSVRWVPVRQTPTQQ
ncbi:MAG: glycosyltransferase [Pseudomonadota bacterium]